MTTLTPEQREDSSIDADSVLLAHAWAVNACACLPNDEGTRKIAASLSDIPIILKALASAEEERDRYRRLLDLEGDDVNALKAENEKLREARSLEFAIEHQDVAKAICLAVSGCDLGPSTDPEVNLQLYDLIPEEWIGGHQTRADVRDDLAENIAFAVLGAWLRATDAALQEKTHGEGTPND